MGFFKNLGKLTKDTLLLPVDLAADTLSGGTSTLHTRNGKLLTHSRLENLKDDIVDTYKSIDKCLD